MSTLRDWKKRPFGTWDLISIFVVTLLLIRLESEGILFSSTGLWGIIFVGIVILIGWALAKKRSSAKK